MGEVPAIGLIRISVSDIDYPRAKEIIEEWDASTPIEDFSTDYNYSPT